jgi:hypothetical protein
MGQVNKVFFGISGFWAQDGILRCRLKAAFRSQPERRLQAAGWALEEIERAPFGILGGLSRGALSPQSLGQKRDIE